MSLLVIPNTIGRSRNIFLAPIFFSNRFQGVVKNITLFFLPAPILKSILIHFLCLNTLVFFFPIGQGYICIPSRIECIKIAYRKVKRISF